ncbi:MAG TPA: Fic family protein [Candidatus Angelobacter sp.]
MFEDTLQKAVASLDEMLVPGKPLTADQLGAVIDLCAWVHSEWVRIHPFANGNGRTARLWANSIALRYGLPPFVRLRPRPDGGYGAAGAAAMQGDWEPTAKVFHKMLNDLLNELGGISK